MSANQACFPITTMARVLGVSGLVSTLGGIVRRLAMPLPTPRCWVV